MNILLIIPNLSKEDRYGKDLGRVGPTTEPLGIAYLAAALKEKRHNIEIIDASPMNYRLEDIKKKVCSKQYDWIGISWLTPMYLRAKETIKAIKEANKDAVIIVGGAHATILPKETMDENPEINYAVIGEGEVTIIELCKAILSKQSLSKVKGIAYRENEKVIINSPRKFVKDIDTIPMPARELLDMDMYRPAPTYYKRLPSHVVITSRGCPYRCSYCSKIAGRLYRHHSVDRVIKEVEILINEYKSKEIIFRDDTFTIDKEFINDLCNALIEKGINKKINWTCMTRVNLVDPELLKLMKESGCWSIHYGIESGSQRLLDLIKKDITLEQAKKAIKWTREAGIETKAFFMLGLPTETVEESKQTINFAKEIDADWIQCTITVPFPGTELYELAKKEGLIKSFDWSNYHSWAGWSDKDLVFVSKGRNPKELKSLQKQALRQFYFRPKVILRMVKQLRSKDMLKMYFSGAYALAKSKFK